MGAVTPVTMQEWMRDIGKRVNYLERLGRGASGGSSGYIDSNEAGTIQIWTTPTAPSGWMICNGAAVSRTAYASLFAAIGTRFGAGDGSTTFNLPDFRGRGPMGYDTTQTEFDVIGESGGAKTHSHALSDLGQAQIVVAAATPNGVYERRVSSASWSATHLYTATGGAVTASTNASTNAAGLMGSTDAASSLSPYRVVTFIIKALPGTVDPTINTRLNALEADTGWVDLQSVVTWNTGWSYTADASVGGFRARRLGGMVQMNLQNAAVAAGTFNIPVSGNITNSTICTGIPAQFRPPTGQLGVLATGTAGRIVSMYVNAAGTMILGAIVPDSTMAATTANVAESYSAGGMYFGA